MAKLELITLLKTVPLKDPYGKIVGTNKIKISVPASDVQIFLDDERFSEIPKGKAETNKPDKADKKKEQDKNPNENVAPAVPASDENAPGSSEQGAGDGANVSA